MSKQPRRRRGRRRRRVSIQGILGARPAGVSGVPDRRAPHPAGFRSDRIQGSRRQVHGAARQRRRLRHSRPPHAHPSRPTSNRWSSARGGFADATAWYDMDAAAAGGGRRAKRAKQKTRNPEADCSGFSGQKEGPRSPARRYARRAGAKTRNAARRAAAEEGRPCRAEAAQSPRRSPPRRRQRSSRRWRKAARPASPPSNG